jgi:hypothetical protein
MLLAGSVSAASAQPVYIPPYEYVAWIPYPNRHAPDLGECVGNCGAGCSDAWNPGCGGAQWWELQFLSGVSPTGIMLADVQCTEFNCSYYEWALVQAMGRWIYHGYFAWGCFFHDLTCGGGWDFFGCLWWAGCGSGWNQDWSYESLVFGWQLATVLTL